jgi:hypothetical protein
MINRALVLAALTTTACAGIPKAADREVDCPPAAEAAIAVPETVRRMYAALGAEDEAGFNTVLTEDFYAYEAGKRFSRAELFALVKGARAAGKRFTWTVQEPDAQVTCKLAAVAYLNRLADRRHGRTPRGVARVSSAGA